MPDYLRSNWVLILSFLFIMANSALIALEQYWFAAVPFAIAVVLLALVATDKLFYFIVFFTPLSINLEEMDIGGIGMFIPTEPLLFGMMIIFFLKVLYDRGFDKKVMLHPFSIAIYIYFSWLLITTLTSSMPIVSIKHITMILWYIVVMYFFATQVFVNKKNILRFFWLYMIPLFFVVIYTCIHHAVYGFTERSAHWVMQPFFKDHTVYGAVLSMMLPILGLLFALKRYKHYRLVTLLMIFMLLLGVILSHGRAAWLGIVVSALISIVYIYKMRRTFVFSVIGLFFIFLAVFWNDVVNVLQQNTQDSTSENLIEHVQSISNISTDASNLERINRWKSAYRMFEDRPVFGFGPGTYMFQYAPFQASEDLTIISTNAGDVGNAHSEFLGPLSESGLLGLLSFLFLVVIFYVVASRLYYRLPKGETRKIVLFIILSFTSYMVNGLLNNFLDTDKASVPFWAFFAIILCIDIHTKTMLDSDKELEKLLLKEKK